MQIPHINTGPLNFGDFTTLEKLVWLCTSQPTAPPPRARILILYSPSPTRPAMSEGFEARSSLGGARIAFAISRVENVEQERVRTYKYRSSSSRAHARLHMSSDPVASWRVTRYLPCFWGRGRLCVALIERRGGGVGLRALSLCLPSWYLIRIFLQCLLGCWFRIQDGSIMAPHVPLREKET
jgi:hypothetical protein